MILHSPLKVWRGKTKPRKAKQWFILNLNNYRNAHYLVLNRTKINYKAAMANQIQLLPVIDYPIHIEYILYPGTKRKCDVGNVISVHQKYFEDALVEMGRIEDDDYTFVPSYNGAFGAVDKDNPRVEIYITKKEIK